MQEVDSILAALIGDIYDASLDGALWTEVFEGICSYVGGREATPESRDSVRKYVDLHFSWAIGSDRLKRYSNDCPLNAEMRRRFELVLPAPETCAVDQQGHHPA